MPQGFSRMQRNEPGKFSHLIPLTHVCVPLKHSFISTAEKIQNTEDEQEKNRLISAFDVGIDVLSK